MKIYRFNKILAAAALLLFASQATTSSKYTISQEEFDRLSKELSGESVSSSFPRHSDVRNMKTAVSGTISQQEFDRLSKELSGSGNYTPFTRESKDDEYGFRDPIEENPNRFDRKRQERLRLDTLRKRREAAYKNLKDFNERRANASYTPAVEDVD